MLNDQSTGIYFRRIRQCQTRKRQPMLLITTNSCTLAMPLITKTLWAHQGIPCTNPKTAATSSTGEINNILHFGKE
jgi:hypothetical protein